MPYVEFDSDLAHVARVCDPRRPERYVVVYHNPNTNEQWLVARVLPFEHGRFLEALAAQGCKRVISAPEDSEWEVVRWLQVYCKEAPLDLIRTRIAQLKFRPC